MAVVEVVYASQTRQWKRRFEVELPMTVREAVLLSGVLGEFPELETENLSVGIFSRAVDLDTDVKAEDRIEIYRPLTIDPKEARKLREKKSR